MKRLITNLLIALATFALGLGVCWTLYQNSVPDIPSIPASVETVNSPNIPEEREEPKNALDDVWLESTRYNYGSYQIQKFCVEDPSNEEPCSIKILKKGKLLRTHSSHDPRWVQFGFFNLLGKKDKQLIVHTYSGGAHCCYSYHIYDLEPKFREIYRSDRFDEANAIGNELVPVDIDGDGIYEFRQSVMTFDFVTTRYAGSVFPPAIFSYSAKKGRYELANRKYPGYVIKELQEQLDGFPDWVRECNAYGAKITPAEIERKYIVYTFIYILYAGQQDRAWNFFEQNYKYEEKNVVRAEVKEIMKKDPTSLAIYQSR
jgi:hypothetical protein